MDAEGFRIGVLVVVVLAFGFACVQGCLYRQHVEEMEYAKMMHDKGYVQKTTIFVRRSSSRTDWVHPEAPTETIETDSSARESR
jgi:hypothetical protein